MPQASDSDADVAGPPSPADPHVPLPTMVRIVASLPLTTRTRELLSEKYTSLAPVTKINDK